MPLYRDFSDDTATILVWKYDENDELNIDELLEPENAEKVKDYHPKKLLEVLMVRKLLKSLKPNSKILYKERSRFCFRKMPKFLSRILFLLPQLPFLKIK
ncbi:hypothetical protein [Chryseobacterium indoltheticum]|uniref:hypothetical protein n=1 Tax=Chryseobacterium indoltheticum TaxID=254 RepID=UPI003F499E57